MKKIGKVLVLILISLFCINNVSAEMGGTAKEKLRNNAKQTISVLSGSNSNAKGYFNGNYISLCEYPVASSDTRYDKINIVYSLKEGNRGFYTFHESVVEYDGKFTNELEFILYGGTKKINKSIIYPKDSVFSIYSSYKKLKDAGKWGLAIENETEIIDNLKMGVCPAVSCYSKYGRYSCILSKGKKSGNNIEFGVSATNISIATKMNEAKENAAKMIGTGENARSIDDNYQITINPNNNITGRMYQELVNKDCFGAKVSDGSKQSIENLNNLLEPFLQSYYNEAKTIFSNQVKMSLITSLNGLTEQQKTQLSLPYIITGADQQDDDNISNSYLYKQYLAEVVTYELHETVAAACATDQLYIAQSKKQELEEEHENGNITDDQYYEALPGVNEELNEALDDYNTNKHLGEEFFAQYRFKIVAEEDKTKGCDVFGPNTTPILQWIYKLIKIGAPLLVVVFGILDFAKALMSGEDKNFKESWTRFLKRLIAAVIVILLPVLLTFILNISGVLKQYGIKGEGNDIYCIFNG